MPAQPLPVDIGSRRELLLDEHLIAHHSLAFRLHHPVAREGVEGLADPYGCSYRYATVLRVEGGYRLYYALVDRRRVDGVMTGGPERIVVAFSPDGLCWEQPVLGLFDYRGSWENNIVWMEDNEAHRFGVGGFSPFLDTNPACPPEHRYKAVAEAGPLGKAALGGNGLVALASPDGLRWEMLQRERIVTPGPEASGFDSQNLAFWDAARGEYRLYRRASYREGPGGSIHREVLTATSRDFLSWSEPQRISAPGAPPVQLYTNNVLPYFRAPHLYLGFPARYVERRWSAAYEDLPEPERRKALIRNAGAEPKESDPTGAGGQRIGTALTDTLFMHSRDGATFHRWGEAFIPPGLCTRENWFYADNFAAWGMATTPSQRDAAVPELSFYLSEASRRPGLPNRCRRYTLRMDGFASAWADARGGELTTVPLRFEGAQLYVNFAASAAGSVRVELQDASGAPLPGYGLEEGVELLGDDLDRAVRWRSGPSVAALAGRAVRVRFVLVEADLFAFQFR